MKRDTSRRRDEGGVTPKKVFCFVSFVLFSDSREKQNNIIHRYVDARQRSIPLTSVPPVKGLCDKN